jgi:hypothetical protein
MKAITAPINRNSPREVIANLQDALQMCLDRGAILGNDPNARQSLSQALRPERERESYRRATTRVLSVFRRERNDAMAILPDHLHVLWTLPVGVCDYPARWTLIKTVNLADLKRTLLVDHVDLLATFAPRTGPAIQRPKRYECDH